MTPPDSDFVDLQTALKGRYSLEREIGRGGMGIVYLARDVALDRPVALKLLPRELAEQSEFRERFLREARTAARLSHPHIVPIHSVEEVDRFVFFAMAYVEGETLGERIRGRGPLTHAEATRIVREVAWALAYAHAQDVVHRDVKPDNILLEDSTGRALVTDFGIAVAAGGESEGEVVGTADFMSPEQASGETVDARSDLYSLGVVGFYAVSGRLPFESATPTEAIAKHLTRPAPGLASVAPDAPARLAGPIDRCLRKDPAERFSGSEEMAEALGEAGAGERPLPVPLRVFLKRLRKRVPSTFGTAAAVLVISIPYMIAWLLDGNSVWAPLAVSTALAGLAGLLPGSVIAWEARKLLKAGYALEDVRHALDRDVKRRNEELAFEYGMEYGWYDRLLKAGAVGGLGIALVLAVVMLLGVLAVEPFLLYSLGVGVLSGGIYSYRAQRRRDAPGERLRKVMEGRLGEWLFRIGSWTAGRRLPAGSATHRPTELAIGMAADRLFQDLPRDVRRELGDVPATVRALESDVRTLREELTEMDRILAEIGRDPRQPGAEERKVVRGEVVAMRDAVQARLTETISALETVRLGLLRLHAGDGTVAGVTMELDAARHVSEDIEGLLAGRKEVERLLGGGTGLPSGGPRPAASPT